MQGQGAISSRAPLQGDKQQHFPPIAAMIALVPRTLTHEQVQQMIEYFSSQLSAHPQEQSETVTAFNIESISPLILHVYGMTFFAYFLSTQSHPFTSKTSWIRNIGATHYVYCNPNLFSSLKFIKPIMMTLPNENSIIVTQNGTVKISNTLILHGLISFNSLTSNLSCSVSFLLTSFFIQDPARCLIIGWAKLKNSSYFLDTLASYHTTMFSASVFSKSDIWHMRLGHPSIAKLRILLDNLKISPLLLDFSLHFHTCHTTKQQRLSFPNIRDLLAKPFDLFHLDIWGTISGSNNRGHKFFLAIVDHYSQAMWVYLIKTNSDVLAIFSHF